MWWIKFKLLCWKNWIMVKRHYFMSALEIFFPIAIVLLLTYIYEDESIDVVEGGKFQSFNPMPEKCIYGNEPLKYLAYTPDNEFTRKLVKKATEKFNFTTKSFDSELNFDEFVKDDTRTGASVGILFEGAYGRRIVNVTSLRYQIRFSPSNLHLWNTNAIFSDLKNSRIENGKYPAAPEYFSACFLAIQNAIDKAFINDENIPSVKLQAFPHPEIKSSSIMELHNFFSFLFVCCMALPVFRIINIVSTEREFGLKESMKMVGLSSGVYWSSWFMRCFIMLIIPFTINCILLSTSIFSSNPIFIQSNSFLVWIFLAIYITSVITFGFLMSVIFKKPITAGIFGSLLFFLTAIIIFVNIGSKFSALSYLTKTIFCLMINANMGIGVDLFTNKEIFDDGMKFGDIFDRDFKMNFSLGELLIFMLIGSFFQLLIALYIERVFPGEFGIAEPWYFPFQKLIEIYKKSNLSQKQGRDDNGFINTDYETEPRNLRVGIEICNVKKKFGAMTAVNNLSLRMFENQITVLLGHNGAGKTTTMNILVGLFSPTSGTAYLDGKDIQTETELAHKSLGVCPQNNILFNDLTVEEHFIFYCTLKGLINVDQIYQEEMRYADLFGLNDKLYQTTQTLSGGMKRKLSVAIALCANTKIVILDEPSSGMDPGARRELWNILISEKRGRTILLSSHCLDEADVLGDRIAIMSNGALRTVGSSFFLKQKFGTGYRITCEKSRGFNSKSVLNVFKEFASDTRVEHENDREITFIVDERKLPIFEKMFRALEDRSKDLKIPSFGCNLSSLEDVFIKLGSEAMKENPIDKIPILPRHDQSVTIYLRNTPNATGNKLILYQIEAIFMKKFRVFFRSWKSVLGMILLSLILLFFNSVNQEFLELKTEKLLDISLSTYGDTTTITEGKSSVASMYKTLFDDKDEIRKINQNMEEFVLKIANKSILSFNRKYIIGATFKNESILAWFNGQSYHSMPLALNTVNRAILKAFKGSNYDITIFNHPYEGKFNATEIFKNIEASSNDVLNLLVLTLEIFVLLLYWPFVFTTHYVTEKETNMKLMQFISGMNRCVYWIASFAFDSFVFLVIWSALYVYILIVGYESITFYSISIFLLLTVSYVFCMLPFSYLCTFIFKKTSTFIGVFTGLSFVLAIGALGIVPRITSLDDGSTKDFLNILNWIGLTLPPYSLLAEFYFADMHFLKSERSQGIPEALFSFDHGGIGRCLLLNFISGLIYLLLCILIDFNVFTKFYYNYLDRPREMNDPSGSLDVDVRAEVEKIRQMSQNEINSRNLILRRLTKIYKNFLAVNQIFLEVPTRECFGMLGVNGAGKTTAFKMMIGDLLISGGDANIKGQSIKSGSTEIYKSIGYCPQFDGLLPELTGTEILKFFALIRGVDKFQIEEVTNMTAREIGFTTHLDQPIRNFSSGNKRKLSASLALLGDPQIIFLDEPTTGIDPQARRIVWNAINKARESGRTVILTSHSMDECEALCTRAGILFKGGFKCLGPVQYLKNKFSKGYVLTIKMGRDDASLMQEINLRIHAAFGHAATFKERYLNILTFHISQTNLKWSEMFKNLAKMKEQLDISEYALTQMTLEQVFLLLTKVN